MIIEVDLNLPASSCDFEGKFYVWIAGIIKNYILGYFNLNNNSTITIMVTTPFKAH